MRYIRYTEFKGTIEDNEIILMSHDEFVNGGKNLKNVPVCVTPDGNEPKEVGNENELE